MSNRRPLKNRSYVTYLYAGFLKDISFLLQRTASYKHWRNVSNANCPSIKNHHRIVHKHWHHVTVYSCVMMVTFLIYVVNVILGFKLRFSTTSATNTYNNTIERRKTLQIINRNNTQTHTALLRDAWFDNLFLITFQEAEYLHIQLMRFCVSIFLTSFDKTNIIMQACSTVFFAHSTVFIN